MKATRRASRKGRAPGATRDSILAAATELFAERGFDGTRVEAIADRARANKAMISYHFRGKLGLYNTIVSETLDAVHRGLDTVRSSRDEAPDRLAAFIAVFSTTALARPSFASLLAREVVSGGRHLEPPLLPRLLGVFALLREIVEQGIREGSIRPVDPLLTHLGLVGSLVFFFAGRPFRERLLREQLIPADPDPASFVAHVTELMKRGLAPRAGATA